jgi:hypothetical protein
LEASLNERAGSSRGSISWSSPPGTNSCSGISHIASSPLQGQIMGKTTDTYHPRHHQPERIGYENDRRMAQVM